MKDELVIYAQAEKGVELPAYASKGSSGADVRAYLVDSKELMPGEAALVPTGIFLEIPEGYEVQVRPRSGLALKHSLTVLNTPGTVDADYRGEVKVILINHGKEPFTIEPGMRIAQWVVCPVIQAKYEKKELLSATSREAGGFGHTGVK